MTREIAKRIVKGITDKIECNTVDIDDWAEFWGFTRGEYKEFLDNAIETSEEPKMGHWVKTEYSYNPDKCSECGHLYTEYIYGWEWETNGELPNFCPNCGARMEVE